MFPDRGEYGVMTAADAPTPPLTWEVVRSWLEASKYYWVVTCRADGCPHARAVWGTRLEPRFHFTTSPETVMARDIVATGYAAVHPESALNVVIIEGAVRRTEGQNLAEAGDAWGEGRDEDGSGDAGMPFYSLKAETAIAWKAQDPRGSAVPWTFQD